MCKCEVNRWKMREMTCLGRSNPSKDPYQCLLCFWYFSESCFFAWLFTQKNSFCKLLLSFNAKPSVVKPPMHKRFYSSHWFLYQIFSLFPIVKRNVKYAEMSRVCNLEADFQQVSLVQFFWNFQSKFINNRNSAKKSKNIFLNKKSKKSLNYRNCIGQTNFWP